MLVAYRPVTRVCDRGGVPSPSVAIAATRLAQLLAGGESGLSDPTHGDLLFEANLELRPLRRGPAPPDVWAVDGGQTLVADARSVALYVTRAARVRWRQGRCETEEEGSLRAHLLGSGQERAALAALGAPVAPDAAVDVNLLRDWGEWEVVAACVEEAQAGGMVLVDGDLQPDWRIRSGWFASLLARAAERKVLLAGVTKHSSLAQGGAPLLGILERQAAESLGARATWWVRVARTRPDVAPGLQVVVVRLDPDAPYAFRVDLPADTDPGDGLGALSALSDDAGFPGYPYPLSVADRLAACPRWLRDDVWDEVEVLLDRAGVPADVRDRAFADRHRMMERS